LIGTFEEMVMTRFDADDRDCLGAVFSLIIILGEIISTEDAT